MRRRITAAVLAAAMMLFLGACSGNGRAQDTGGSQARDTGSSQAGDTRSSQAGVENMVSEQIKKAAEGTTVTFYGWGGDEKLNRWLDNEFARVVREKYDITVERVPVDIGQVLSQFVGEIQAGEKDGSIDMIWVNGENFRPTKESNMLYGPFTDKLPNFNDYVNGGSEGVTMDFVYPIEGYEAPYGKAQLIMMTDLAVAPGIPGSAGALREFAEKYPGGITYPALPGFASSAFVRNIIYEICGYEQFMNMEEGKKTVEAVVAPTVEYLGELDPYLWNQGAVLPNSSITMDNMFADGELVVDVTYGAYDVVLSIEDGKYANTTTAFQFDKRTIGSANFMAIVANSGNRARAMMAINEMMSLEIQADRCEKLRVIPVLDNKKLSGEQKAAFGRVDLGKGTMPQDESLFKRLLEMPAQSVPIIEGVWTEEIVGK